MFEPTSRYYGVETTTLEDEDGRTIAYKRRRFLPRGETMSTLAEITVGEGDRLDLIAARTLGSPLAYWRICDAENAMNPRDLDASPGRTLRVPVPEAGR